MHSTAVKSEYPVQAGAAWASTLSDNPSGRNHPNKFRYEIVRCGVVNADRKFETKNKNKNGKLRGS